MGQYTLELREIIENNVNIFDFEYPIFSEDYREEFQKKIIDHFYFREIGFETVGRFKYYLRTKLNEIMPYYNKFYTSSLLEVRILDNYEVTETFDKNTTDNSELNSTNNTTASNINLKSETPEGRVDISSNDYVSEIDKDNGTNNNISEAITQNDGTEKWTRTMKGNIGVQTDSEAISVFQKALVNVDLLVMKELNELFMGVY